MDEFDSPELMRDYGDHRDEQQRALINGPPPKKSRMIKKYGK